MAGQSQPHRRTRAGLRPAFCNAAVPLTGALAETKPSNEVKELKGGQRAAQTVHGRLASQVLRGKVHGRPNVFLVIVMPYAVQCFAKQGCCTVQYGIPTLCIVTPLLGNVDGWDGEDE